MNNWKAEITDFGFNQSVMNKRNDHAHGGIRPEFKGLVCSKDKSLLSTHIAIQILQLGLCLLSLSLSLSLFLSLSLSLLLSDLTRVRVDKAEQENKTHKT